MVHNNISNTILSQKCHVESFMSFRKKCMKLFSNFLMRCEQTSTEKCFIKWHWLPGTDYQTRHQHDNSVNVCTGTDIGQDGCWIFIIQAFWILHNDMFSRWQESQEVWRYFVNMTSIRQHMNNRENVQLLAQCVLWDCASLHYTVEDTMSHDSSQSVNETELL